MAEPRRHNWASAWQKGQHVAVCDDCQQVRTWGKRSTWTEFGCPGTEYEQQQQGPNPLLPPGDVLSQAMSERGITVAQMADAFKVDEDKIRARMAEGATIEGQDNDTHYG